MGFRPRISAATGQELRDGGGENINGYMVVMWFHQRDRHRASGREKYRVEIVAVFNDAKSR